MKLSLIVAKRRSELTRQSGFIRQSLTVGEDGANEYLAFGDRPHRYPPRRQARKILIVPRGRVFWRTQEQDVLR